MVWNQPADEGRVSEFNAAGLKMKRLDKIEDSMNEIHANLFAWNEDFGVFNFELKFARCDSLYQEVESKLSPDERKKGIAMRNAIKSILKKHPVIKKIKNSRKKYKIDEVMKEIVADWLFKYETLVRKFKDVHGMDTSYSDREGLI